MPGLGERESLLAAPDPQLPGGRGGRLPVLRAVHLGTQREQLVFVPGRLAAVEQQETDTGHGHAPH